MVSRRLHHPDLLSREIEKSSGREKFWREKLFMEKSFEMKPEISENLRQFFV